jgi:hypothetical protein
MLWQWTANGGIGFSNKAEAMKWYNIANEFNDSFAIFNYGVGLEQGFS